LTGIVSEQQLLAGAELRYSNWRRRDRSLSLRSALFSEDRDAFFNRGAEIGVAIERETTLIWQKRWTYRVGAEALFTQERDRSGIQTSLRDYVIAAAPATVAFDATDDLLDPREGVRFEAHLSPEASLRDQVFGYAVAQLGVSGYFPASDRVVLAGRALVASIAGSARRNIAPSRRLYAGGGGSVRGFGFQDIGPLDTDGNPIGGRSKIEGSLESRFRFGDFGAAVFADVGQVYTSSAPGFDDLRVGVGGGLRYYTSFGPIRVDAARALARRDNEPEVAVYVSIGQAF
jgi:translocation and assembly module TamA